MMRRQKWIPLIVLPMIIAACFTLWVVSRSAQSVGIQSEDDVWDLRYFDFTNKNNIARLGGKVTYIPNALLTPEAFDSRADEALRGYPEDVSQYATSRMYILAPDGWYAIQCLSVDYAERVYVNGRLMYEIGSPGESRGTNVPDTRNIVMTVQPVDGVIELVIQGSNFVHREGGGHAGWRIGNAESINDGLRGAYVTNIMMGCYLSLFVVHMILFFLLRTYRVNLLFALSCLMWFLRTGVTWTKVFSVLFSWMPWVVKFRIEYMTFPVTAVLFIATINSLFPSILQKWYLYAMSAVMALFASLFLFTDTLFMSRVILWCEGIFYASIAYIAVRFIMKLRRCTSDQVVLLMGAALFMYSVINDVLYYNGYYVFPFIAGDLSQLSMLAFVLFEAVAIFIATARGIEEAKAEEQRLAIRVQISESQLGLQREQYARMMQNAEKVKSMRHDLHHHLAVIKQFAETGNVAGLHGYIEEYASNLTHTQEKEYCGNYAVNAITAHYLGMAESEGVDVETYLDIPQDTGSVPAMDLCVVMGNFLENAVEACRRMEHGERFIRARARIAGDTLSVVVQNSFDGQWREDDGVYLSRKTKESTAAREGVGLASVKAVCEKHRGIVLYEITGDVWKSSALVHMEEGH